MYVEKVMNDVIYRATKMWRKMLSHYNNLASQLHFLSRAFCYTLLGIKAQFIVRKDEQRCLPIGQATIRKC